MPLQNPKQQPLPAGTGGTEKQLSRPTNPLPFLFKGLLLILVPTCFSSPDKRTRPSVGCSVSASQLTAKCPSQPLRPKGTLYPPQLTGNASPQSCSLLPDPRDGSPVGDGQGRGSAAATGRAEQRAPDPTELQPSLPRARGVSGGARTPTGPAHQRFLSQSPRSHTHRTRAALCPWVPRHPVGLVPLWHPPAPPAPPLQTPPEIRLPPPATSPVPKHGRGATAPEQHQRAPARAVPKSHCQIFPLLPFSDSFFPPHLARQHFRPIDPARFPAGRTP